MAEFKNLLVETRGGGSYISINRPEARNALNAEVIDELSEAVELANADPETRCIVLTGAGGKAFCAGADLVELGSGVDKVARHESLGRLADLFTTMWAGDKPTIARVDGWCLAGGLGLALACDIVVAGENSRFGAPEVRVGLWPYLISLPMARAMGPKQALRLMLTGEQIDAAEARELGVATAVVPRADLDATVDSYVDMIALGSPQGIALGRRAFYSMIDNDPTGRLNALHANLGVHLSILPDAAEGLAAFAEKRSPRFARTRAEV